MRGLGSFTGAAPSAMGLGSFATPAPSPSFNAPPPGLPSVNPNTGTTTFQQTQQAAVEENPPPVTDFWVGHLNQRRQNQRNIDRYKVWGAEQEDGRYAVPAGADIFRTADGGKGLGWFFEPGYERVQLPASTSPLYTGDPNAPYVGRGLNGNPGNTHTRNASWERGFASGGLVSLGQSNSTVGDERQTLPHPSGPAPLAGSPDATADPESEKIWMGAMMALDPGFPMSGEERQLILSTFVEEFGEEALQEIEAELMAGKSDGTSDSIPAVMNTRNGPQPAALSEGEFVIPADVVSGMGNGSTDAGARRLMEMIQQIREGNASNVNRPIGPSPLGGGMQ